MTKDYTERKCKKKKLSQAFSFGIKIITKDLSLSHFLFY